MSELLHVSGSRSPVTLERTSPNSAEYHICVDGVPAYRFGFACGTCDFYFSRLAGADGYTPPADQLRDILNSGVKVIDEDLCSAVLPILPDGVYEPRLIAVVPERVTRGSDRDYWSQEARLFWDPIDRGDEFRPDAYYRGRTLDLGARRCLFEFVAPIVDHSRLEHATIARYVDALGSGEHPTALALSFFEIKEPIIDTGLACDQHWLLTHYLLDGHHKLAAAASIGMPVRVLSFGLVTTELHEPGGTMPTELSERIGLGP